MYLKSSWKKLLAVVALFVIGMVLLSVLELFGGTPEEVQAPVPKDCLWVARIDANTFWKTEVYAVLFEADDESVMKDFKKLMNDKYITKESKPIALDNRRDIVAYQTMVDGKLTTVVVLQLSDPTSFEQNMKSRLGKSSTVLMNGSTAMIVYVLGKQEVTESELKAIAKKLSKSPLVNVSDIGKKDQMIAFKSGVSNPKSFEYGFTFEKSNVNVNGEINFSHPDFSPMTHVVKAKGFSFYCANIPEQLGEAIVDRYSIFGKSKDGSTPHITGISIDYQGILIGDAVKGFPDIYGALPLPKFNAIVRCDQPVILDSILKHFPIERTNIYGEIPLGDLKYYVQLIDKYTFFFGIDPTSIQKRSPKEVIDVHGDLSSLTEFDGSMFMTAFISNVKEVKAMKDFFGSTGTVNFTLTQKKGKTYSIEGNLPFKDGKNTFNELTKLLFTLNLVK